MISDNREQSVVSGDQFTWILVYAPRTIILVSMARFMECALGCWLGRGAVGCWVVRACRQLCSRVIAASFVPWLTLVQVRKKAGQLLACQRSRNSRRRIPKHPPRQSFLNSNYRVPRLTKLGALDKSFCINFFIIYGGNRCPKALEPFSKIANVNCPAK